MSSMERNTNITIEQFPQTIRRSRRTKTQRELINVLGFTRSEQKDSYNYDHQRDSALANMDPLEMKGRELWNSSLSLPRASRFLGKFQHKFAESWCFYPLKHGSSAVTVARGKPGIHYADSYSTLGQMVENYGFATADWPDLPAPITIDSDEDQNDNDTSSSEDEGHDERVEGQREATTVASDSYEGSSGASVRVIVAGQEDTVIQMNSDTDTPQRLNVTPTSSAAGPRDTSSNRGRGSMVTVTPTPTDTDHVQNLSWQGQEAAGVQVLQQRKTSKSPLSRLKTIESMLYGEDKSNSSLVTRLKDLEALVLERAEIKSNKDNGFGLESRLIRLETKLHIK